MELKLPWQVVLEVLKARFRPSQVLGEASSGFRVPFLFRCLGHSSLSYNYILYYIIYNIIFIIYNILFIVYNIVFIIYYITYIILYYI